jgi:hypothetical protein
LERSGIWLDGRGQFLGEPVLKKSLIGVLYTFNKSIIIREEAEDPGGRHSLQSGRAMPWCALLFSPAFRITFMRKQ